MSLKLIDITDERLIKIGFGTRQRNEVLQVLIDLLVGVHPFETREALLARFIERENIMSTAVGSNTALPHITSDRIEEPALVIGIEKEGIRYDESSDPVKIIFLFVGPAQKRESYLDALVRTSKILKVEKNRSLLIDAPAPAQVLSILKDLD